MKKRPESTKNKPIGFFNKLKRKMRKKDKKDVEMKFARENVGSTPKKVDPE